MSLALFHQQQYWHMENEHNSNPYCNNNEHENPANSLLGNLLDEGMEERHIFNSNVAATHKQEPPQWQEIQENQRFDLRTIQKQQLNRNLPQKLDSELPEDDALQMSIGFRQGLFDSGSLNKKYTVINKIAYLNQTRQDKIARYRQKKYRRIWVRKISYGCRKVVADSRERKNGRFVKKDEDKTKQSPRKGRQGKIQNEKRQEDIGLLFKVEQYYN